MKKKIFFGFVIGILLIPVLMWATWVCMPKQKLVVAIIDKTVPNKTRVEHASLFWVLNHNKYGKTSKELYKQDLDYFGFFPQDNGEYKIKGLERFSYEQLEQLSMDCDMAYYTDAYGLYNIDWFGEEKPYGVLYGGLSMQDIEFMRLMKTKQKLVVAEFDILGDATKVETKKEFEALFHMKWTGWTGKSFGSLDREINKDIPLWIINNYEASNKKTWAFKDQGIVLVKEDKVVVLEYGSDLKSALPTIKPNPEASVGFPIPEKTDYTFWFDVIEIDPEYNEPNALFQLDVTDGGNTILDQNGIPSSFPAITTNIAGNYKFVYLSGDFSESQISMTTSYFKGIETVEHFFYASNGNTDRNDFFWKFYKPMMGQLLEGYNK